MSGQLQDYTVDQLAGAVALTLGALGSLLLVIWQSRCMCRCRIGLSDSCYVFDCAREPPPLSEPEPEPELEPESLIPTEDKKTMQPEPEIAAP